jgi:hypothetical protein
MIGRRRARPLDGGQGDVGSRRAFGSGPAAMHAHDRLRGRLGRIAFDLVTAITTAGRRVDTHLDKAAL